MPVSKISGSLRSLLTYIYLTRMKVHICSVTIPFVDFADYLGNVKVVHRSYTSSSVQDN